MATARARGRCRERLERLSESRLDCDSLRREAIADLQRVIGFDRWCWPLADPETLLPASGLALHYMLSVRFVFDAPAAHKGQSRLVAEFALSGLAGMAITALVIAVTVDFGGMPLLPAKILAVGVSFLVVFALRRRVVFAGRRSLPARGG